MAKIKEILNIKRDNNLFNLFVCIVAFIIFLIMFLVLFRETYHEY